MTTKRIQIEIEIKSGKHFLKYNDWFGGTDIYCEVIGDKLINIVTNETLTLSQFIESVSAFDSKSRDTL